MKKLLALVLALVMSMSLVTISNAAFKDADKISNKEAVDVMAAVGVLAGYDNGEFGATDTLTRAQACKIIAYLDLGGKTADAIKGSGTVFSDVAATAWYAGYVEYCAGAGYVAGIGGGKFDPNANVTGVQFAKMLLCALGYKAEVEGYTGSDYTIAIARDANKNGLFDDLSIATSANLTREQAAQMAFNALEATVVEYQGGTNVTTGDTSVVVNATRNEVANKSYDYNQDTDAAVTAASGTQQLCEKLYGKDLKLDGDTDALKRPAHVWNYKGTDIGTYADSADYTFVANKAQSLEDSVKKILNKSDFELGTKYYVNGEEATVASDDLKVGDVVELYMSSTNSKTVAKAAVIRYSQDKVTGKVETSTKDGKDYVKVPGVTSKLEAKYVKGYESLAKGDYVYLYTTTDSDRNTTYNLFKAASFEGKLTETKNSTPAKYVINGTTYVANGECDPTINTYNTLYTYYTDANGYIIAAVEKEDSKSEYVVIQKAAAKTTGGVDGDTAVEARLVKMDGTTMNVTLAEITATDVDDTKTLLQNAQIFSTATENSETSAPVFFTYTVNSDGEYELEEADDDGTNAADTADIAKKPTKIGDAIIDNGTVLVLAKAGENDGESNTYKYVTYTGKANIPAIDGAEYVAITNDKGVATYVLVYAYTNDPVSSGSVILFVKDEEDSTGKDKVNGSDVNYKSYTVIDDGKETTIKVKTSATGIDDIAQGQLMTPSYNSDGYVTKLDKVTAGSGKYYTGNDFTYSNGTLVISDSASFTCAAEATVFVMDADANLSESDAESYSYDTETTVEVYVVCTNNDDKIVNYVYVVEADA